MHMAARSDDSVDGCARTCPTRAIYADVGDWTIMIRGFVNAKQLIEARNTERLSRRHLQLLRYVVETAWANPASFVLQRMQCW